jgi:hypothetical protein
MFRTSVDNNGRTIQPHSRATTCLSVVTVTDGRGSVDHRGRMDRISADG